ncbi:MAG: pilin [Candidatus Jacksonbacteria bacterium]
MRLLYKILLICLVILIAKWLINVDIVYSQTPQNNMTAIRAGHFGLDNLLILTGLCQDKDPAGVDGHGICDGGTPDVRVNFIKSLQLILGFVSLIALTFVIYGGLTWATAGGSPERVKKGKDILIWASVGLVVVVAAWGLVTAVMSLSSQIR